MDEPRVRSRRRHAGSKTTYQSGCRCDGCVEAKRVFYRDRLKRRRAEPIPGYVVHGEYSTYGNWGCLCDACKEAARAYRSPFLPERNARRRAFSETIAEGSAVHRKPWTAEEIEVARDRSLTMRQVALQLGRTVGAVDFVRRQLRGYVPPSWAERKQRRQVKT